MNLLKERLAKTGAAILSVLFLLSLVAIVLFPLLAMVKYFPNFMIAITFVGAAVYLIYLFIVFVNWLFIEPFRKKRDK